MSQGSGEALLRVEGLSVRRAAGEQEAVLDEISFEIQRAEVVGMMGESGSGKTTLALTLLGLVPAWARISQGGIRFGGHDMLELKESELEKVRGAEISMIFQQPELALNPVMRAIDQVTEVVAAHRAWSRRRCREAAIESLAEAGLEPSARLLAAYPHELSGGQRQRLVIAQALACRPKLLIADEPTASLDTTLRVQWAALMRELRERLGLALFLITHDPAILAGLADRVLVMYCGRIVEEASLGALLAKPLHPYTEGLLRSRPPRYGEAGSGTKHLPTIPGMCRPRAASAPGCPFEPRCGDRFDGCREQDPLDIRTEDGRRVRCLKYGR